MSLVGIPNSVEEFSVDDMDVLAEILANDIREAENAIATAEEEFLNDTEPFSEDLLSVSLFQNINSSPKYREPVNSGLSDEVRYKYM